MPVARPLGASLPQVPEIAVAGEAFRPLLLQFSHKFTLRTQDRLHPKKTGVEHGEMYALQETQLPRGVLRRM